MKKPSALLKSLAAPYPRGAQGPVEDEETGNLLLLTCQDCGGIDAWVEWVAFNSRCTFCGSDRAAVWPPKEKSNNANY